MTEVVTRVPRSREVLTIRGMPAYELPPRVTTTRTDKGFKYKIELIPVKRIKP
jgi:hypothetical protein